MAPWYCPMASSVVAALQFSENDEATHSCE